MVVPKLADNRFNSRCPVPEGLFVNKCSLVGAFGQAKSQWPCTHFPFQVECYVLESVEVNS